MLGRIHFRFFRIFFRASDLFPRIKFILGNAIKKLSNNVATHKHKAYFYLAAIEWQIIAALLNFWSP